jgi:lysyl endopeptidase
MLTVTVWRWRALAVLASLWISSAGAAPTQPVPVRIVKTDLKALIRAAADVPVQFAVLVPHSASTASDGTWSTADGKATWRYAVQVPTAISLSFHASNSSLPQDATLVVRGAKTTTSYRAQDLHRGELWSRIQPGEALQFTLTVAASERTEVVLNIISLQAGYRAIGAGVSDHPYYRQLRAQQTAASGNESCVTNYECEISASNTPPGAATIGLIIGNLWQCTGSLINDIPGDNTPYVLTARHCETGQLGGGNPGAASTVSAYWDATTPCGSALGSLYDPGIPVQTGAQTIVEQQDAWLIQLDQSPVVSDAQFTGFDASGGTVQGGYSIQHAVGYDKQFTEWYGDAYPVQESGVLGSTYVSNFWLTVNQLGNVGQGASGGGLFDQNNHLVGSLTLGYSNDASGYGACPVSPLTAPSASNWVAAYTALASVWNSTADGTSSTGSVTLKSVLDPANTGALVVSSRAVAPIAFAANPSVLDTGQSTLLTWNVPNATQCAASGGLSGDGWSGTTLPASGSQSVTEGAAVNVSYKLTCKLSGGGSVSATAPVVWNGSIPFVQVYLPRPIVWASRPIAVTWTTNVPPCTLTGGGLSQSGLGASGSVTTTQNSPTDVTYQVSCGAGQTATSGSAIESYVTPSLQFLANGSDRKLGEVFQLGWSTYADVCSPSGGAPNDGWSTTFLETQEVFSPKVAAVGTYTYTLQCSAGPLSVQQSVTVTFENNAPYVTASATPLTVQFSASPADYITVNWTSNLTNCGVQSSPALGSSVGPGSPFPTMTWYQVDGPEIFAPAGSGTFTLTVSCSSFSGATTVTSAPITVTVQQSPPPTATISITPATVTTGQNFTITWSSTNASSCDETGGAGFPGTGWGLDSAASGTLVRSVLEPSQWTLGILCHSIDPNQPATATAQATVTVTESSGSSGGGSSSGGSSSGGSSSGGSSSGGGGHGGVVGTLELTALALLLAQHARRRIRRPAPTARTV